MSKTIIITMLTLTLASGIAQKILASQSKMDEAAFLDMATKAGMALTAISVLVPLIAAIKAL